MSLFRYRLFQIILFIAFLIIAGRLFQLQLIDGHKLLKAAKKHQEKTKSETKRGDIVDRYGKALAIDISNYTLEFNPNNKESRTSIAEKLSGIISFNPDLLFKGSSQTLARNLSKDQARRIKNLNSSQLYLRKMTHRYYPQLALGAHVLGYVDFYGKARQGIEAKFEEYLRSHPEEQLKLSIDSRLQALSEKALRKHIEETKAQRGTVLIMKTDTGEILSWAIEPGFNLNEYHKSPMSHIKNWAAIDVYQPGSIFKIITVASALESKTIPEDYTYVDEGFLKVDRWKVTNHEYIPGKTEPEELDLLELFVRSSNTFAGHVALKMGPELFHSYIKAFGFGKPVGIELVGETQGLLRNHEKWKSSDTATTGIGQGAIAVSPLQLVAAVNTIANNGTWVKPSLLEKSSQAKLLDVNLEREKRIISKRTARKIRKMLTKSIEYNTSERDGVAGNVPGLEIAGKTGTAQKVKAGGGYDRRRTVASFLGFFPANKPKYIALVVVDDPKTKGGWGDKVAGPLFNDVVGYMKNLYSLH